MEDFYIGKTTNPLIKELNYFEGETNPPNPELTPSKGQDIYLDGFSSHAPNPSNSQSLFENHTVPYVQDIPKGQGYPSSLMEVEVRIIEYTNYWIGETREVPSTEHGR